MTSVITADELAVRELATRYSDAVNRESPQDMAGVYVSDAPWPHSVHRTWWATQPCSSFSARWSATTKAGALLIFDEATVFRIAIGGAQGLLGVEPDLPANRP